MGPKTILVTGANRGIGFSIIQALATREPTNTYLLGTRSATSGADAIARLHALGLTARFAALELDVTSDASIAAAVQCVVRDYGGLDVLVNNAGYAAIPPPAAADDGAGLRAAYADTFAVNVTGVAAVTGAFLGVLRGSADARVVNVSSGRASIAALARGDMPPAASVPYSVSKVALNVLTLEMARTEKEVLFQLANPGHCRTAFNGFRGKRDPLEGAGVVVELVCAERGRWKSGFWAEEGGVMKEMEW
ncbi:NAD(P)-binding protein [Pseudovirgaria hyperparasitica]|uniref:NAD(P)-binding protein n=1 Tax=Pseudovirgaria hyperparasitica TaxID=470096 RepID=A0A6A6WL43_9PEZI|nr:NAD(P)-binding protein [Pseudovirgaria hyperparasitica]KAF2762719.1 NAD(P)-binding protein [Pseudovirgaria hyperparasitica]